MRCSNCESENRSEAKFCAECAAPLPWRCPSCGVEVRPNARFCDQCGSALSGNEATSEPDLEQAVRKTVTVLFCDVVGSTSFGEKVDAESARETMGRYHEMATEVIERLGGTVAKFIGDGVMALFGAPSVAEDDADRAVAAGLALQVAFDPIRRRVLRRHGVELGLRVGINTGEVVVAVGDADLVGDAINTAARLEGICTPGDVLVSEATWRLTRARIRYEVLGEVEVRGKEDPVATFRVVGGSVDDDQVTPFVGRSEELSRLIALFGTVVADRAVRLATVIGAPGLGKTRLARELRLRVADRARVVELRCERSGTSTFGPIIDLLRSVTGLTDDDDEETTAQALGELVDNLDDARRVSELLRDFIGMAPERSTEESFLAVRRLVESIARRGPLVVIVDDIQWAEPLFLDLLEHLVDWVEDAPTLLVCLARPELREIRSSLAEERMDHLAVIPLEGLEADATAQLAARLIGAESLPVDLAGKLPDSTEGNPLFVRELMRMLVDDRVIEQDDHGWQLTIDAEAVEVPPTIQSLIASRLERLPADERRLVELAAVVGFEFPLGAVTAISGGVGGSVVDLRRSLDRLRRRELVEPTGAYLGDEPIFQFHHVLIRDAAYRRLLKRTRSDLHLQVADWMQTTAGRASGEHDLTIAHHLERVHEYRRQLDDLDDATVEIGRRAAALLGAAAERALGRDDATAAGTLAARALRRLEDGDRAVPDLLLLACESLLSAGAVKEAEGLIARLEATAIDEPQLAAWSQCYGAQLAVLTQPGRLHDVERRADAAADRLAQLGDAAGVAKARSVRAGALARLGRVGDCELELDLALSAARAADDRRRVTAVLGAAPIAALWGPSPIPRAGGRCLDVVRLLRITIGSPAVEATSVRCQAVLEALCGRFDPARSMLASSRATVEELGLRHGVCETDLYAGIVELLAANPVAAEPLLRSAYAGLGRMGIGADAGQAAAYLARALLAQGRLDEADELAGASDALAGRNPQTAISARAVQAEVLAAQGDLDGAMEFAEEAVEVAGATDLLVDRAYAQVVMARVCHLAGDETEAERATRAARALYEQKAATVELAGLPVPPEPSDGDASDADPRPASSDSAGARVHDGPGVSDRAGDENPWNEADRSSRRSVRHLVGRDDTWVVELADDVVLDDRRRLVGLTHRGRDETERGWLGQHVFGHRELRMETLATRGDNLVLHSGATRRVGGLDGTALEWLGINEWNPEGRLSAIVIFDPDDLGSALETLDGRFLETAGDPVAAHAVHHWATQRRVYLRGDRTAYLSVISPAVDVVDHRTIRWPLAGYDGLAERFASRAELDGTSTMVVHRILRAAVGRSCVQLSVRFLSRAGVEQGTRGYFVIEFDPADGSMNRLEQFDNNGVSAALDRFEESERRAAGRTIPANQASLSFATLHMLARNDDPFEYAGELAPRFVIEGLDGSTSVERLEGLRGGAGRALGIGVEQRRVLAVRGERLALAELIDAGAAGEPVHRFALEEIDQRARFVGVRHFAADDLDGALAALETRWIEVEGGALRESARIDSGERTAGRQVRPNAAHAAYQMMIERRNDGEQTTDLLADEFVCEDRRPLVDVSLDEGGEGHQQMAQDQFELGARWELGEPLAVRGDRFALCSGAITYSEHARRAEDASVVALDGEGLMQRVVLFEPDDIAAALEELQRQWEETLDDGRRNAWRVVERVTRAIATADREGLARLIDPAFESLDHRLLGSGRTGRDEWLTYHSGLGMLSAVWCREVHLLTHRVFVGTVELSLDRTGPNARTQTYHLVDLVLDGRLRWREAFDDHDLDAALQRAHELVDARRSLRPQVRSNAAHEAYRKIAARWNVRRHATDLLVEEFRREDRRPLVGMPPVTSAVDYEQVIADQFALSARWHIDEPLAVRDDRFCLGIVVVEYSGESRRVEYAFVMGLAADGLVDRLLLFEPDDIATAHDALNSMWEESLDAARAAVITVTGAGRRAVQASDAEALSALRATGFRAVDHRTLGAGEVTSERWIAYNTEHSPSTIVTSDVHELTDRMLIATTHHWLGTSDEAVPWATSEIVLIVVENGRQRCFEVFDDDQLVAALARARELGSR